LRTRTTRPWCGMQRKKPTSGTTPLRRQYAARCWLENMLQSTRYSFAQECAVARDCVAWFMRVLYFCFYVGRFCVPHNARQIAGPCSMPRSSGMSVRMLGTVAGTGAHSRLKASATVFASVGRCPTDRCRPCAACRHAISGATVISGPFPLRERAFLESAYSVPQHSQQLKSRRGRGRPYQYAYEKRVGLEKRLTPAAYEVNLNWEDREQLGVPRLRPPGSWLVVVGEPCAPSPRGRIEPDHPFALVASTRLRSDYAFQFAA
jgi:hypothetical protein